MWLMAIRSALRSLRRHRMRSALTALGVIIGVAALLATAMIGEGAQRLISQQIASMGSSMLVVIPGMSLQGGLSGGAGSGRPLLREDLLALQALESVRYVASLDRATTQVISGSLNWSTSVLGTTAEYIQIRDWPVAQGRFWTREENDRASKVCVLRQTVAQQLFGAGDPMGQIIRVKQMPCEVIGLLEAKGQSATGTDQDDTVLMPSLTLRTRVLNLPRQFVAAIMVASFSDQELFRTELDIRQLLRQRHRLTEEQEDDFTIRNLSELVQTQRRVVETQTSMLRNVAAVSLLVGGIGIMNIMLVSVTERTREIGIRLAIGARERDILLQFLIEAIVLSVLGGLLGVLLGTWGGWVLAHMVGRIPVVFSSFWAGLAFGTSGMIGMLFGFYPARKAARLDPIQALRYE